MSSAAILEEARRFVAGARERLGGDGRVQILSSATTDDAAASPAPDDDAAGVAAALAELLGTRWWGACHKVRQLTETLTRAMTQTSTTPTASTATACSGGVQSCSRGRPPRSRCYGEPRFVCLSVEVLAGARARGRTQSLSTFFTRQLQGQGEAALFRDQQQLQEPRAVPRQVRGARNRGQVRPTG